MLAAQDPIPVRTEGDPRFEAILMNPPRQAASVASEENYCPDCHDCDINCEECDSN